MKFILGLTFESGDKELARRQMQAAIANLPPSAIVSFEVGNEVGSMADQIIPLLARLSAPPTPMPSPPSHNPHTRPLTGLC